MSPPRKRKAKETGGEQSGTRALLIETALRMLAERGVHGVSMNQIVQEAGARNPSAILYHFGSREGLLRAVLQHIAQMLKPLQKEMWQELENIESERPLKPRELVAAVHMPVLLLYFSDTSGMNAARLLSRCTWEFGEDGQRMLVEVIGPSLADIHHKLRPLLGENRPPEEVAMRFLLSVSSLFHAVPDMDVISHLPIIGPADARKLIEDPGQLMETYLDFQCYGLLGNPH